MLFWFHLHIKIPSPILHITLPSSGFVLPARRWRWYLTLQHWCLFTRLHEVTSKADPFLSIHHCENIKSQVEFNFCKNFCSCCKQIWHFKSHDFNNSVTEDLDLLKCDTTSLAGPYANSTIEDQVSIVRQNVRHIVTFQETHISKMVLYSARVEEPCE